MKNLILVFLIIPFSAFAKFYNGNVNFNDGTSKKGFIEIPDYPDDSKLKFRSEERGKTEKFQIDLVKGFEIINEKNEVIKYLTILLAEPKIFTKDKYRLGTKKSWVRIIKEGKIDIYQTYSVYNPSSKSGGEGSVYIHKKDEIYAYAFATFTGGFNFVVNGYSSAKNYIHAIFKDDCPNLSEIITKEALKQKGYSVIVDLYEENCGK